jgi:hypothetical protein
MMASADNDSTGIPSATAPFTTANVTAVPPIGDTEETAPFLFCGTDAPPVLPHPSRCACGCIPNILSLFEMAELRKQARLKKEQERIQRAP